MSVPPKPPEPRYALLYTDVLIEVYKFTLSSYCHETIQQDSYSAALSILQFELAYKEYSFSYLNNNSDV